MRRQFGQFCALLLTLFLASATLAGVSVPILCYHRFGPTLADSMTTTTAVLEQQLTYLHDNGYHVIPLKALIDYLEGRGPAPAAKSVVITVDDGHRSVYEVMKPLIEQYRIPVTLFIYPSAISNARYAMTWDQLRELRDDGLFTIQSHTYWHPNFKIEKRRQSPADYEKFVAVQLAKSKSTLEKKLGVEIRYMAWPFGIYDAELLDRAKAAGYESAFSIDRHAANDSSTLMAVPRFLMTDADHGKAFERLLTDSSATGRLAGRISP